jgi:type II secretory pathway component PulC
MNKIILRAITAFSRTDLKNSEAQLAIQGREIQYLGKDYVALETESTQELLALYRCMNRGELKRLKRWPADLTSKMPDSSRKNVADNLQKTPVLLELSPVKKDGTVQKSKKSSGRSSKAPANQTDLFE